MFRSDIYSKVISRINMIDDISEEEYNKLKEKTMPKKKKKKKIVKKKKKKTKKKRK